MISVLLALLFILVLLLLLLAAFLFLPAKLQLGFANGNLTFRLSLLGFPLFRLPPKKEQTKRTSKKQTKNKQSSLPIPPKGADFEALLAYAKLLLQELGVLSPHTKLTLHTLWITPPKTDDAASQALLSGAVSGSVAAFLGFLDQNCTLVIQSPDAIRITPNFMESDPSLQLSLAVTIPPYRVLGSLVRISEHIQKN